jgi:glutathione S-transferase
VFQLYYAPRTCALACLIALEEAEIPYKPVRLDFSRNEQRSPEYLAVNPKGRVPTLVTPEGTLTETPAILAFLAQRRPGARLAPTEPFAFARAQSFNSYLCSTVHVAHAHGPRGARWADEPDALEAMKRKVPQSMLAAMLLIEEGLLQGPWVMGQDYTMCDPYLFTLAQWLEGDGVDMARLPRVLEHRQRVAARPAVQRALAVEAGASSA